VVKITGESLAAALEKLRQLRRKEILSEEEFAVRKQEILFSLADGALAEGPEDFLAPLVPLLEDGTLSQEEILVLKEFSLAAARPSNPATPTPRPATGDTPSGAEPKAEPSTKRCPSCGKDVNPAATSCKHCGADLAAAAVPGRLPTRNKPSEVLGTLMLLVPATGAMLLWFWVGEMALIQDPGSKLTFIACVVVLATAVLAAVEAGQLGMGDPKDLRGGAGPVRWFLSVALLWVIGFPAYLHQRRRHGMKNLVVGGAVVAAVFGTIVAMLAYRIEATKAAIREQLAAVQEAIPSGETIDAPTPPPRGKPRWERETSSSPLDTSPTVVLTLESEAAIDGAFGKTVYPHLVLRCQKRQTEAYVNARVALTSQVRSWTSDYSWGSSTRSSIRWRLDEDKPVSGWWLVSDDYEAVFAPQPVDFIKRLAKRQQLLLELDVSRGGTQTVTFNLSGLSEMLPELRAACKW
jgi:hypothetical protein